ncbi:glucose-1-phosphate cytidylyltransferase [Spirulina sp. 06S082]|uniref:glucose-1-phosphate cytidylyltransferase n=1 Tax=Spirulina sp. 06S082 TaxID=3110248 RepID=UPI002B214ED8|nr:glucose-1-phosphate cytidylyltransferase [Spirulina sp. 06S082]MEA5468206.1 glucose-1-phosphate cytidylyltransferase [Spirulina sp. 06S082]
MEKSPADIPVVILCGGRGTRLKEETEWRPKPMVSVGERPILWHIMKIYAAYGFKKFILCLGYKGDMIREYFLNYDLRNSDICVDLGSKNITKLSNDHDESDWSVSLVDTGQETMTGGRLKIAARYLSGDTFCLTYGDGVANVDLGTLLDFHLQKQRLATITAVRPSSRYGELFTEKGIVKLFTEKPQTQEGWINGGFFILNKKVLDFIESTTTIWEQEPLQKLVNIGELAVYEHTGFWQCMDTYREMEFLNELWLNSSAPWRVW